MDQSTKSIPKTLAKLSASSDLEISLIQPTKRSHEGNKCHKVCSKLWWSKTKLPNTKSGLCPLSLFFYCPCHYVVFGCGFGQSLKVVRHCRSRGLSPCPHPCKGVLRPATVPIISHPSITNDQTPAGCRVIIIMTKRARGAKRAAEGETENRDGNKKKEEKAWVRVINC